MLVLISPFYSAQDPSRGDGATTFRVDLSTSVNNPSQTGPEVRLLGDSRSCQDDSPGEQSQVAWLEVKRVGRPAAARPVYCRTWVGDLSTLCLPFLLIRNDWG